MDDDELGIINCPNCGTRCQPEGAQWVCRYCGVALLLPDKAT